MSDDSYIISSFVSLSGGQDSILIPLFRRPLSNYLYVCRTDILMNIVSFDEMVSFEGMVQPLNSENYDKIEYKIGDLCPIILMITNQIHVFSGEYLEYIISELEEISSDNQISSYARDLLSGILECSPAARKHPRQAEVDDHLQRFNNSIKPAATRLWLDNAIRSADPRVLRNSNNKFLSTEEVRLSLLAWAHEIFEGATTQAKKYFLEALRKSDLLGVYVEDIYAAFIIREATIGGKGVGIIDLARTHRKRFRRAPLSSLLTLTANQSGPFHTRATGLIEPFFKRMETSIEAWDGPAMLRLAFMADHPEQWPGQLISGCDDRARSAFDRLEREMIAFDDWSALLEIKDVNQLKNRMPAGNINNGGKFAIIGGEMVRVNEITVLHGLVYHELASRRSSIMKIVGYLDCLRKIQTGSEYRNNFSSQSVINFDALGLDRAWVARYVSAEMVTPRSE